MTSSPCVSIGLPFLNAGPTLLDALRSVLAQTFEDWELLLVDDGSTDDSLEMAKRIQDRRACFSDGANKGLADGLNQIAALAIRY